MAKDNDLLFSLGVDEAELKNLEKRLQATVNVLQKALTLKNEPLTPALKGIGDAAQKSVKPLSDLEKASKSLAAAQKVISAEVKAGLITQDQAITKLKGLSTEYSKTAKSADSAERGYKELTTALGTTVTATTKLEAAQVKSQKALQADTTRKYKDAQNNLRTELERGAISVDRYRVEANDLQNEMVELRDTLPRTSKEFGALDRVIGQNTRGITTASGQISKLGLSQQVALGSTQRLGSGFLGLAGKIGPLVGVAGIGGVVTGLVRMQGAFQEANKSIRTGTGATGEALEGLTDSFKIVAKSADQDLGTVATVLADLNTRTGATGDELEALTATMLDLADVTGEEVNGLVTETTRLFGDWGVSTEKQADTLDYLFKVSQNTGISVGKLSENLVKYGAPLRQLGFDFETSAALMGKFEKEGVNTELVLGSLRIALGKMSKEGVTDTNEALSTLVDRIQGAGSAGEANALAIETFGSRAGPDMAAAIREGRFEVDELLVSLENSQETIAGAAEESQTFNERMAEFRNSVAIAAEPLSGAFLSGLEGALGLFQGLPGPAQSAALGIGGVTASVGVLGGSFGILRTAMLPLFAPPTGLIIAGVAAAVALGVGLTVLGREASAAADGTSLLADQQEALKTASEGQLERLNQTREVVDQLADAQGEEGLLGILKSYGETLDTSGKAALEGFITGTLSATLSQQGYKAAVTQSIEEVLRLEKEALRVDFDTRQLLINQGYAKLKAMEEEIGKAEELYARANESFLAGIPGSGAILERYGGVIADAKGNYDNLAQSTELLRKEQEKVQPAFQKINDAQAEFYEASNPEEQRAALLKYFETSKEQIEAAVTQTEDGAGRVATVVTESGDAAETSAGQTGKLTTELKGSATAATDFIDTLAKLNIDTVGEAAAQSTLDLEGLGETIRDNQRELASDVDATEAWGKVYERVYGDAGAAATKAAKLEQEAFFDRAKSRDAIVEANERAAESASVYDEAAQTVFTTQDAAIEQNENSIASLRDLMTAQRDFNERLEVSGGLWKDVTPEASDFSDVLSGQQKQLTKASQALNIFADGVLADLPDAYAAAISENDLFNTGLSDAEVRAEVAKEALEELIDAGLDPQSEAVQEAAAEWQGYQTEVDTATELSEALTEAQEGLADSASLTQGDIDDLRTSLLGTADATGELSVDAQNLLHDLNALEVVRGLGELFGGLGTAAGAALDLIPERGSAARQELEDLGYNVEALEELFGGLEGAGNAALEVLQDGFDGAVDSLAIAGGAVSGFASALEDDIGAAGAEAVGAIGGIVSAAANGFATGGVWGAAIGGGIALLDGIIDVFGGIQRDQQKTLEAQEKITEEISNSTEAARDFANEASTGKQDAQTGALQEKLDYEKLDTPEGDGKKARLERFQEDIAQAKIDLLELEAEYQPLINEATRRITEIDEEIRLLQIKIDSGTLTAAQEAQARTTLGTLQGARQDTLDQLDSYTDAYGFSVGQLIQTLTGTAEDLGISQSELYEALLTGNDEILGQLSPQQQGAIREGIAAYVTATGELPAGLEDAAAALGISTDQFVAELGLSGTNVSAAATGSGDTTRQAVAGLNQELVNLLGPEAAEPIRQAILAAYNKQAGAITEGGTTLTSAAVDSGLGPRQAIAALNQSLVDQLGPEAAEPIRQAILAAFNKQAGAFSEGGQTFTAQANTTEGQVGIAGGAAIRAPGDAAEAAKQSAADKIRQALAAVGAATDLEGGTLAGNLGGHAVALSEAQHQVFNAQKEQVQAQTAVLRNVTRQSFQLLAQEQRHGVFGKPGGLVQVLTNSRAATVAASNSFFNGIDRSVTGGSRNLVGTINTAADDVRRAMERLVSASTAGRRGGGGSGGGGGGGGSGGRSIQGFFAPMHSFVDDRALGGMGDGFGTLDTWGIAADTERNQFGFGTSFSQPVQPVGDSYQGGRNRAGALSGLLQSVRAGVEAYKLGVLSSVNSARETQARGFSALGYDFRKGLIDEAKRNGKAVKKTKDEYKKMEKDFLATFDRLGGRSLLKSIGGVKSPLFDLAKDIGTQVQSGTESGLKSGIQGFIFGTGGIQESLAKMTFDSTVNSLLTTVLSSGLLEKLFDGAYTNLTKKLVQGDIQGAIEAMKGVLGKLPQVTGQLEQIFAPLKDAAKGLGFYEGAKAPEFNNLGNSIRLEARSLGSATPNWVLDMGRHFDTFGKSADLNYKAAVLMDRAVRRFDASSRSLEVNRPRKLV